MPHHFSEAYLSNYSFYVSDSGEASPTIWSCYANFSVFIDRIRNQFLKEMNNDNDLNLHSMTKLSGWLRHWFKIVAYFK